MLQRNRHFKPIILFSATLATFCTLSNARAEPDPIAEFAKIAPERTTGFAMGGWNVDRYPEQETLKPHGKMKVADLKGPGVIKQIHMTRHAIPEILIPREQERLFARGIVLEIWFDDAKQPAVVCPVADFFGDGCNATSMDFTSNLIECAPGSYNCFFPMPFKKRARVFLRNDTDQTTGNYTSVEWETLPEWKDDYGYFHATYLRKVFRLLKDTDETFLDIQGKGNLIGRQFSIATDDPAFIGFGYLMEGNNEVDIDGKERALDYLGSEDSFGFSWGWIHTFAGHHSGITRLQGKDPAELSVYRFHDPLPIRFNKSLKWKINWGTERHFHGDRAENNPYWDTTHKTSRDAGGCWVDYATVHYWYQNQPGGFEHKQLRPVAERTKDLLKSNKQQEPGKG